jgi:hypothetical protein
VLHLSLIYPLVLFPWTQRMGEARGNLAKIALHLSLSLQPALTPNQHPATAQMNPRAPPASACSAPASHPLPRGPRSPRAHPCRPRCRGQASPCHRAINSSQPPSSTPNRLLPPMPSVGRTLASLWHCHLQAESAQSELRVPSRGRMEACRATLVPARHRIPFTMLHSI